MTRDKIPQTETFSHLFLTLSSRRERGRRPQKSRPNGNTAGQKIHPHEARHSHPLPNRRLTISLGRPTPQAAPIVREASRLEKPTVSLRRRNDHPPCRAGRRRHRRRPSPRHRHGRRHFGRDRAGLRERSRHGARRPDSPGPTSEPKVQALRYKNATM